MLSKEFIEKTGLSEAQVTELNSFTEKFDETQMTEFQKHFINYDAELRKKYDGTANQNAERILDGAAKKVEELTGIKREQGVKIADYFTLAGTKHISDREKKLKEKELELEEKIKNGNGDPVLKKEFEETKKKLDILLQKEASIDEIIKGDYKNKYETLAKDNLTLKQNNAFASVKPSFPAEVNPYESAAKWKEFISGVQEKYTIEFNQDGEAIAIDKENQYKIVKLSDLVKADKEIIALATGRQQQGLGHKKPSKNIEGVPFAIPTEATPEEIQKAIKDYLLNDLKLNIISPEYAAKFAEFNTKIRNPQKTAK